MKSAWLLAVVLLLSCGCSNKDRSQEKPLPRDEQPQAVKPEEEEIKAATPDDPGQVATVVVPLEVLKKQARAQTKSDAAPRQEPLPIDHPVHIEPQESKHFLHKVFPLSNHAQFTFLVPPHQGNAKLRGTFRSFTKRTDPGSTSDSSAAVDLMLLNEQQFDEFLHGRPQSVTYELDSANNQMLDWRVPTTYGEPQKYYLVFSNSAGGAKIKFVEADFTISFE